MGGRKHPKRAFFHDYCSPGFYMITATTLPGSPRLSEIPDLDAQEIRKGEMIIPDNTRLGEKIKEEIQSIPAHHPEMRILRFVIMPDHIHIVLQVTARLKRMLGSELAGFFGACSKASSRLLLLAPWPENVGRKSTSGYTEFHQMNDLALAIASLPHSERLLLKGK